MAINAKKENIDKTENHGTKKIRLGGTFYLLNTNNLHYHNCGAVVKEGKSIHDFIMELCMIHHLTSS